jgi:YfiH family protein
MVRFTGRAEGDLADPSGRDPAVAARRQAVASSPWTWLRQVHGGRVVLVNEPGEAAGEEADAAVCSHPGAVLAVLVADCAPVAFGSPEGVFAVAHAGWQGLLAGIIPATVDAMRRLGATGIRAALGPCIHAECYEFGAGDLDRIAARLGDAVRARDRLGRPALDLQAAVRLAVEGAGAVLGHDVNVCTACSGGYWSWRSGRDRARQAVAAWRSPGTGPLHRDRHSETGTVRQ